MCYSSMVDEKNKYLGIFTSNKQNFLRLLANNIVHCISCLKLDCINRHEKVKLSNLIVFQSIVNLEIDHFTI